MSFAPSFGHRPIVDLAFHGSFDSLRTTAAAAGRLGAGFFVSEADHDAFVMLAAAAEHTRDATIGTAVAIAFSRTPMSLAYAAHDLQRLSHGRLILGLGTQIAPHVVKRFGMPWSRPADRMREYVLALRAIWSSWQNGTRLAFEGDFYAHTLMPQAFSPGPLAGDAPPIWLAAVGPRMVEVAAEVADGLVLHPLTSVEYRDQVLLPSIRSGPARTEPLGLAAMAMVATGRTEQELAVATALTRRQIAFYASTPDYLQVLAQHGWEELHHAANEGMRSGKYLDLADLVDDTVLKTFAVVGDPQQVVETLRERYGAVDRVLLTTPFQEVSASVLEILALSRP